MTPYLSVIIPVFNEQKRINKLLEIDQYLSKQRYSSQIVVVSDGSTDNTLEIIKDFKIKNQLKIISYSKNQGKGQAIKEGMLNSDGQFKLFTDIDLSTPIETVEEFLKLTDQYEVIIGTRKTDQSSLIKHQPFLRETLGKCFTLLSQIVLGVRVSDFTCGFKLFSNKASVEIFSKSIIKRWGFDSEILFLANKYNYKIKEVPVRWINDEDTKVNLFSDSLSSLWELVKVRLNALRGIYAPKI